MKNMNMRAVAAIGCGVLLLVAGCGGDAASSEEVIDIREAAATAPPDFDITDIGLFGGLPFIQVKGVAGGTIPSRTSTQIFAYVMVTNLGVFALASHNFVDSTEQVPTQERRWHAHRVTLDSANCIATINDDGLALMSGNKAYLVWGGKFTFKQALTAVLSKNAAGKYCVTQVHDTFTKP